MTRLYRRCSGPPWSPTREPPCEPPCDPIVHLPHRAPFRIERLRAAGGIAESGHRPGWRRNARRAAGAVSAIAILAALWGVLS